jgi:hypothetical protein
LTAPSLHSDFSECRLTDKTTPSAVDIHVIADYPLIARGVALNFDYQFNDMDYRPKRINRGRLWAGLFLLAVGGAFMLHDIGIVIPNQLFNWHLLLAAFGVFLGLKHNFRGAGWLVVTIIGAVCVVQDYYPDIAFHRFEWPGVLLLIGVLLLARHRGRPY